jgi:putative acetyltransferase
VRKPWRSTAALHKRGSAGDADTAHCLAATAGLRSAHKHLRNRRSLSEDGRLAVMETACMPLPPGVVLRPIQPRDDAGLAAIARQVQAEFGAGSAADPEVDAMQRFYSRPRSAYFVVEREGRLGGGAGIAPLLGGTDRICDLRKFYLLPGVRGIGLGQALLDQCLLSARGFGYGQCYVEVLDRMSEAQRLLEANSFQLLQAPMGYGEMRGSNTWYLRSL